MKNQESKGAGMQALVLLLTLIWLSNTVVGKADPWSVDLTEFEQEVQAQVGPSGEEAIPMDTAGEIVSVLRKPNGEDEFQNTIRRKVTREAGWNVIVTELPDHVSSFGEWEFVAVEDYSGTEVKVITERGFLKALKVGDSIVVRGRIWSGAGNEYFSYVRLNQGTVESREYPGWWAANGSRPFAALSRKQKGLFILACLLLPILFVAWKNSR